MYSSVINKISPEPNSGCWLWTGAISDTGYGNFGIKINGKSKGFLAHRYVYENLIGKIPAGLHLDHLCKNRCCVNPAHLEPVTTQENTRRGNWSKICGNYNRNKTHCPKGHEYTEENTLHKKRGRHCRKCYLDYMHLYNAKKTLSKIEVK